VFHIMSGRGFASFGVFNELLDERGSFVSNFHKGMIERVGKN